MQLIPPRFIAQRYEVIATLGKGLSGEVFKVLDHKTGQTIALKLLKEGKTGQGNTLESFKTEFEILKNLRHPNIARILDFGIEHTATTQNYFFTEELIEGKDLWEASKKLSLHSIEELFVQALRALEFLHTNNIYHLDLKPFNLLILLGKTPKLKIIDFGMSAFKDVQYILGTPAYTAPEIILNLPRGAPADLYSLGVIFYKCFTRINPFQGGDIRKIWNQHLHLKPLPPTEVRPELPKYLDILLLNLLEKKPKDRYPRAASVIRSLNYLADKNYPIETGETFVSYLPEEGKLIGREEIWHQFTTLFEQQLEDKNCPSRILLIHGDKGIGKTRLLKEMQYHAQLCEVMVRDWEEEPMNEQPALWLGELGSPLSEAEKTKLQTRLTKPPVGLTVLTAASPENIPISLTLELLPFSLEETRQYTISATGIKDPPPALIQQLFRHSEGLPQLLRDILQKLMESGALLLLEGHWDEKALAEFIVPWEILEKIPFLAETFSKRWNDLTERKQTMLTFFAMMRHPVPFPLFQRFFVEDSEIVIQELIRAKWVLLDEDKNIAFANPSFALLRLRQLTPEQKMKWHDQIADLLIKEEGALSEINEHQSFGSGVQNALNALPYYTEECILQGKLKDAKEALDRALELAVVEPWWGKTMLKWMEQAYPDQAQAKEVLEALECLKKFEMPDPDLWNAELILAKSIIEQKNQRYQEARAHLQKLVQKNPSGLPKSLTLRAKNLEGKIYRNQGKLEYAEEIFQKTFEEWLSLPPEEKKQVTNNDLATCLFLQQKYEKSWQQLQNELPYYLDLNDPYLLSRCYYQLGCAAFKLDKTVEGITCMKKCIAAAQLIQETDLLLLAYNELGNLYFGQDRLEEALAHYEHALNLAQYRKDHSRAALIAANIGSIHRALGQEPQCFAILQFAMRLLDNQSEMTTDDWLSKGHVLLEFSRYYQRHGEAEKAKNTIEEAYALAKGQTALNVLFPQIEEQYQAATGTQLKLPTPETTPETVINQVLKNLKTIAAVTERLAQRLNRLEQFHKKKTTPAEPYNRTLSSNKRRRNRVS